MPEPISNANSSYYDPNPVDAGSCDPAIASCARSAASESSFPRETTQPPATIAGDAGARQLVQQFDAAQRSEDCSQEAMNASLSCAKAGLAAAGGALVATTGVGILIGAGITLAESISCGKDLRALYDCKLP